MREGTRRLRKTWIISFYVLHDSHQKLELTCLRRNMIGSISATSAWRLNKAKNFSLVLWFLSSRDLMTGWVSLASFMTWSLNLRRASILWMFLSESRLYLHVCRTMRRDSTNLRAPNQNRWIFRHPLNNIPQLFMHYLPKMLGQLNLLLLKITKISTKTYVLGQGVITYWWIKTATSEERNILLQGVVDDWKGSKDYFVFVFSLTSLLARSGHSFINPCLVSQLLKISELELSIKFLKGIMRDAHIKDFRRSNSILP